MRESPLQRGIDPEWSAEHLQVSQLVPLGPEVTLRHSPAKASDFGWSTGYAARIRARAKQSTSASSEWKSQLMGFAQEVRGSVNIVLGTVMLDPYRRALGNRQRLVGILQRNGRVDRRVVQEFVDRWTTVAVKSTN